MGFSNWLHRWANPTRFVKLSRAVLPYSNMGAIILIAIGLYGGLYASPPDYLQGDSVRMMYVHVPAAWMALFAYTILALSSAGYLIWRHAVADAMARAASAAGICFTGIALITGMLWGKPAWGTAWVWDARLTSVLVLFFLYLAHMIFIRAFDDAHKAGQFAAVLAIVGFINIPIIKFSVDWWSTLHQPASISRLASPSIHESMLWPLLTMAAGFWMLLISAIFVGTRAEIAARRIRVALRQELRHG